MLPEGSQSSNFITIEETFYIENIGKGFKEYILKDVYQDWLESKKVKPKETKLERRMRYSLLMKENGWTRAELSRQLGVSRAWVTMTLGWYLKAGSNPSISTRIYKPCSFGAWCYFCIIINLFNKNTLGFVLFTVFQSIRNIILFYQKMLSIASSVCAKRLIWINLKYRVNIKVL